MSQQNCKTVRTIAVGAEMQPSRANRVNCSSRLDGFDEDEVGDEDEEDAVDEARQQLVPRIAVLGSAGESAMRFKS